MPGRTRRVRNSQSGGGDKPKLNVNVDQVANLVATALITSIATVTIERSLRNNG